MLYNNIALDEGFYRVGKTFDIGDTVAESVTTFNLGGSQYKHKGMLIKTATTTDAVVGFQFYDPTGSSSAPYVNITVPAGAGSGVTASAVPFILPARVSSIRITNPAAGGGSYNIRVSLIN